MTLKAKAAAAASSSSGGGSGSSARKSGGGGGMKGGAPSVGVKGAVAPQNTFATFDADGGLELSPATVLLACFGFILLVRNSPLCGVLWERDARRLTHAAQSIAAPFPALTSPILLRAVQVMAAHIASRFLPK